MTRYGLSVAGVAVGVKGGCHAGLPGKVIDCVSPEEKRNTEDSSTEMGEKGAG